MNVDYQELINVMLWQKARNDIILPEFVCVCLCNLLIINNSSYVLLLDSYDKNIGNITSFCLDLGYRYQSEKGIMVRVGLCPGVALKTYDESGLRNKGVNRAAVFYPYVGVGYNF